MATPSAIIWSNNQLQLLDQRILPVQCEYLHYQDPFAVADAIRAMVVRGAPAIGITAAYGMVLAAQQITNTPASVAAWCSALAPAREALANSRPTAVNLFWALDRCDRVIEEQGNGGKLLQALTELAVQIHAEDIQINQRIGDFGASLIAWGIIKVVIGLRVTEEEEFSGVDIAECGMEAYPEFANSK